MEPYDAFIRHVKFKLSNKKIQKTLVYPDFENSNKRQFLKKMEI